MRKKYSSLKYRAKKRNLEFNLSFDEYCYHKLGNCSYCGVSSIFLRFYCEVMGINTPYMSIDRKDNNKGYTSDNVTSACFLCNKIKGSFFSYEEMKEIGAKYVYPKFKKFEQEALDSYQDWCEDNVYQNDE